MSNGNYVMKGSKTRYATRKGKQFGENRVCIEEGCEQILSKYNSRKECFQHHKFKQPRVRGMIDPREKD
jgi:hypothetical protein